jgi:hypothetical protein
VGVTDLGTYIKGDTGTDTIITLVDEDGAAMDLSGASAITLECVSPQRDLLSIAGSVSGAGSDGHALFEDLAQAFTPTATRRVVHFTGVVRWTQAGESWRSRDRVRFAIELFP